MMIKIIESCIQNGNYFYENVADILISYEISKNHKENEKKSNTTVD